MREGYCEVPNWFLEALTACPFMSARSRVLLYFYRQSYGWLKSKTETEDPDWRATIRAYCRECAAYGTGLDPTTVSKEKSALVKLGHLRDRPDKRVEVNIQPFRSYRPMTPRCVQHTSLEIERKFRRSSKPPRKCVQSTTEKWSNGHSESAEAVEPESVGDAERQALNPLKSIRATPPVAGSSQLGSGAGAKEQELWERARDHWFERFPSDRHTRGLSGDSWAQKLIGMADRLDVDPFTLIDCVPLMVAGKPIMNPRGYLLGFKSKYPLPDWAYKRGRIPQAPTPPSSIQTGPTSLGDILSRIIPGRTD